MQTAAHALTQQFLAWVDEAPRSYADAEAWRRSCPHLSIWEDAISDGLVHFQNGSSMQSIAARAHAARARAVEGPLNRGLLRYHLAAPDIDAVGLQRAIRLLYRAHDRDMRARLELALVADQ